MTSRSMTWWAGVASCTSIKYAEMVEAEGGRPPASLMTQCLSGRLECGDMPKGTGRVHPGLTQDTRPHSQLTPFWRRTDAHSQGPPISSTNPKGETINASYKINQKSMGNIAYWLLHNVMKPLWFKGKPHIQPSADPQIAVNDKTRKLLYRIISY